LWRFKFLNKALVEEIFGEATVAADANIVLTVGMPPMYDAMVRHFNDTYHIVFDLINMVNYITQGIDAAELARGFLSHELIHIMIYEKYPETDMNYAEYYDYIAFHEGFAHLLSYAENIHAYELIDSYKQRFNDSKARLAAAINETDPKTQEQLMFKANTGKYWEKFAAVAGKLYLMKHIDKLKEIYEQGWMGFVKKITDYNWE